MCSPHRRPPGASHARSIDLAVVILTFNEERHIERAIDNVRAIAREVVVVDSHSSDRTVELARASGATVISNRFLNQAKQFDWALNHAEISASWILRLDADERLSGELIEEIRHRLPTLSNDVTGVNLNRRHIFLDRWIRRGGRYPLILLRMWRRGAARIEQRWMDEHIVLERGRAVTFENDFADHNLNDLSYFIDKHNKYATREAIDVLIQRYALCATDAALLRRGAPSQASTKRWAKERIYNRLPFWLGPFLYFLYRYFVQLGILDGFEGLIYHGFQGFWYRLLVGAKVFEFDRTLKLAPDRATRLAALARLTGYDVKALSGEA